MKAGTFQKRLCEAVRRRREATGLTQEEFADLVGIHRAYYSRLERGEHNVTLATLEKISAGLKIGLWEIAKDAGI